MKFDASKMTKTNQELENEKRRIKRNATRVNSQQPLHYIKAVSDVAVKDKRLAPKVRYANDDPDLVRAPTFNRMLDKDTYKTGMGEVLQAQRPGSEDFLRYPSKGT